MWSGSMQSLHELDDQTHFFHMAIVFRVNQQTKLSKSLMMGKTHDLQQFCEELKSSFI